MSSPTTPDLIGPLSEAATALGRLDEALRRSPLLAAWLWRETARTAVTISQNVGHRLTLKHLVKSLAGVPGIPSRDGGGLAAGDLVWSPTPATSGDVAEEDVGPLQFSVPMPKVDLDAVDQTLAAVLADLAPVERRAVALARPRRPHADP